MCWDGMRAWMDGYANVEFRPCVSTSWTDVLRFSSARVQSLIYICRESNANMQIVFFLHGLRRVLALRVIAHKAKDGETSGSTFWLRRLHERPRALELVDSGSLEEFKRTWTETQRTWMNSRASPVKFRICRTAHFFEFHGEICKLRQKFWKSQDFRMNSTINVFVFRITLHDIAICLNTSHEVHTNFAMFRFAKSSNQDEKFNRGQQYSKTENASERAWTWF